jgi:hypothetical protein
MPKKSSKRKTFSKKEREWIDEFVRNEVAHGTPENRAKTDGISIITRCALDNCNGGIYTASIISKNKRTL